MARTEPANDNAYRKVMKAAATYMAAVQECIDADTRLQANDTARRLGPESLLSMLCVSGIVSTERVAESPRWRKKNPRARLLFVLRPNVSYTLKIIEHPNRSLRILSKGVARKFAAIPASSP
jgi:hypothetical protein